MANSRRLILPGVGAFVRRTEGGEIVFVEMFKQNDGVLTNLISLKMDISAEQANILIERLITELQHDLRYYGYYTIPALGTLRQTEKGIIFQADAPASLQAEQPQAVQSKEVTPPSPRYEKVEEYADNDMVKGLRCQLDENGNTVECDWTGVIEEFDSGSNE